jgi:hypothetical protein
LSGRDSFFPPIRFSLTACFQRSQFCRNLPLSVHLRSITSTEFASGKSDNYSAFLSPNRAFGDQKQRTKARSSSEKGRPRPLPPSPPRLGMTSAMEEAQMKTFYLIKSLSPFLFLLTAPRVLEAEMARQSFFANGPSVVFNLVVQILFAIALFIWFSRVVKQKKESAAFLKMSCVSKKVFHDDRWITVEQYLSDHHNIVVSHGMTPEECADWKRQALDEMNRNFARHQATMETERSTALMRRPVLAPALRPLQTAAIGQESDPQLVLH